MQKKIEVKDGILPKGLSVEKLVSLYGDGMIREINGEEVIEKLSEEELREKQSKYNVVIEMDNCLCWLKPVALSLGSQTYGVRSEEICDNLLKKVKKLPNYLPLENSLFEGKTIAIETRSFVYTPHGTHPRIADDISHIYGSSRKIKQDIDVLKKHVEQIIIVDM